MKASQTHHQKQYCRKGGNHRCGSELARDEALTSNIIVDCYAAIASKLAPTGDLLVVRSLLLLLEQPLPLARRERRHFIRSGRVHGLENFQLFTLARKDPGVALAV